MINFWVSFVFLIVNWLFLAFTEEWSNQVILLSSVFFILYFMIPIVKKTLSSLILFLLPFILLGMFSYKAFNGSLWLIFVVLAIQSTNYLNQIGLSIYLAGLYLLAISPYFFNQDWYAVIYASLLALLTTILFFYWKRAMTKQKEIAEKYDSAHDDLQFLKRQFHSSEQLVRQEERNQIAREIHDSVGHQLTALLMQMEVARIQTTDKEMQEKLSSLKKLAQNSLHETREAVKTLKSEETAGIQAIIQLIRKLELESQLRLSITMQTGVLRTVLTNQQSITIYRSLQEALTNMMRHGVSREATIEFQIVAQRDLRFQVSHPIKEKIALQEGFGLTNMRERLAEIGGKIVIEQVAGQFKVIGQFPLEAKTRDKDFIS